MSCNNTFAAELYYCFDVSSSISQAYNLKSEIDNLENGISNFQNAIHKERKSKQYEQSKNSKLSTKLISFFPNIKLSMHKIKDNYRDIEKELDLTSNDILNISKNRKLFYKCLRYGGVEFLKTLPKYFKFSRSLNSIIE